MNYRHRPHKDKRSKPTAASLQQLVIDTRYFNEPTDPPFKRWKQAFKY